MFFFRNGQWYQYIPALCDLSTGVIFTGLTLRSRLIVEPNIGFLSLPIISLLGLQLLALFILVLSLALFLHLFSVFLSFLFSPSLFSSLSLPPTPLFFLFFLFLLSFIFFFFSEWFCSVIKGITLKIRMSCFILINSVLLCFGSEWFCSF